MYSLNDWVFYPLAGVVIAGMVAGALAGQKPEQRTPEEILDSGVTFEGQSLFSITLGNGLDAQFISEGEQTYVSITAARGPLDGIQSAGAFYTLTPQELEVLQGQRLRVSYSARRGRESGASNSRINLFIPGRGQGDWFESAVSNDFETIELEVTPVSCEWAFGFIGIWPDWAADQDTIEVNRVSIMPLGPAENC